MAPPLPDWYSAKAIADWLGVSVTALDDVPDFWIDRAAAAITAEIEAAAKRAAERERQAREAEEQAAQQVTHAVGTAVTSTLPTTPAYPQVMHEERDRRVVALAGDAHYGNLTLVMADLWSNGQVAVYVLDARSMYDYDDGDRGKVTRALVTLTGEQWERLVDARFAWMMALAKRKETESEDDSPPF